MATFEQEYREAMDELYLSAGAFGNIAASLGKPRANENIPTAQVSWDPRDKLTVFEINPQFFHSLSPQERGAIIAHEAYHVLLGHLQEASDPYYRNTQARLYAQECIINDGLPASTGLPLPLNIEGAHPCLGPEMFGTDFSYFTTRQGYDYIIGSAEDEGEHSENSDDGKAIGDGEEDSSSSSNSKGGEDSQSSEQELDPTPNDNDEGEDKDLPGNAEEEDSAQADKSHGADMNHSEDDLDDSDDAEHDGNGDTKRGLEDDMGGGAASQTPRSPQSPGEWLLEPSVGVLKLTGVTPRRSRTRFPRR